jgi:uncharacterized protein involved in cysteine biosynthesis
MHLSEYAKAIAAFLAALVGLVALFVPSVGDTITPDIIVGIALVAAPIFVFAVPNKREGFNVATLARELLEARRELGGPGHAR